MTFQNMLRILNLVLLSPLPKMPFLLLSISPSNHNLKPQKVFQLIKGNLKRLT